MADITLSEDLTGLLLEAVWELDKLGRTLPVLVPLEDNQAHFAVKGIAGRMIRLTGALMEGLRETVNKEDLEKIINFDEAGAG